MITETQPSLGILLLESGREPGELASANVPNSAFNPATFDFPLITETVEGAWVDRVIPGDPSLEPAYIAAARRLVARGAVAICGDCGFTIRYQAAVSASVNVPVAMSSLLLIPTLLRQLPAAGKLAVLSADSTHCDDSLLGISDPAERARVVVGGIEGGIMWQNEMSRPTRSTSVSEIESDVAACVSKLRHANPDIAALLFECTMFPVATPAIRRMTGLPIYDTATLYRMTFASVA
ncbi:Asp/Glu/hydantoin racemase protein [Rhizobium etli]|uniref:Asp/Glu/hydantoin racemase protein n=1 Tax=Rhizobium etli TaxID=29449 RepID=UPI00038393F4|nr:Asp/Glu/hydantoin racemase protein [Rhizobium etli]AGS25321.1 Asp/Glu/hydantoin racemase protein [Rhizobium etli bv. mimosae str. Mim1]